MSDTIGRRFNAPIIMSAPRGWRYAGPHRISRKKKAWLRRFSATYASARYAKRTWGVVWEAVNVAKTQEDE